MTAPRGHQNTRNEGAHLASNHPGLADTRAVWAQVCTFSPPSFVAFFSVPVALLSTGRSQNQQGKDGREGGVADHRARRVKAPERMST